MEQYSKHIIILGHGAKIFVYHSSVTMNIRFISYISFAVAIKFCSSYSCFSSRRAFIRLTFSRSTLSVFTKFVLCRISTVYQTGYFFVSLT